VNHERIRLGGGVRRFHTRPTIDHQTVAAHSWGVAALLFEICDPSVNLLRAAIYHDVAEYDTGDIPATAKWMSKSLKATLDELELQIERGLGIEAANLSREERWLLKFADMLELVWYSVEQRKMGNRYAEEWYENGTAWMEKAQAEFNTPRLSAAIAEVENAWSNLYEGEPS